ITRACRLLFAVHVRRGELGRARALVEPARAAHEDLGFVRGVDVLHHRLAAVEALAGNWPAHESTYRRLHETALAVGKGWMIAESAVALGESLSRQGRLEEAARLAAIAEEQAGSHPYEPGTHAALLRLRARLRAHEGAHDEAERLAREALAAAFGMDSPW